MNRRLMVVLSVVVLAVGMLTGLGSSPVRSIALADELTPPPAAAPAEVQLPATVAEARARARLLHETIHGVLQVVHRDYFRADELLAIPSRSLEDVFHELARSHQVQLRWLAVTANAMDIDHEPQDDFEKAAVEALKAGQPEFESASVDVYRYVGSIRLASQCLKCHLPLRKSNQDRAAGLAITMPLKQQP